MNRTKLASMICLAVFAVATLGADALAGGATIKGKVNWEGKTFKGKRNKSMTPECKDFNGGEFPRKDRIVTNKNGTLRNVLLYVKNPPDGKYDPPSEPVLLDQVGCMYVPHVIAVMKGQDILIRNSDDTAHNIHATPSKNKEFNKSQPKIGLEFKEKFKRAEMDLPFKCDVHPWMKATCHVMDHPFFSMTREEGTFEITGLPPGKYTLVARHERYGELEMEVTVATDETKEADFNFSRTTNKE